MNIIGVDPGTRESAVCVCVGNLPKYGIKMTNDHVARFLADGDHKCEIMAIERPVCQKWSGAEVGETILWSGRFIERFIYNRVLMITRPKIKALLGIPRGNDSAVRKKLIEIYGSSNLPHLVEDMWQAAGVAEAAKILLIDARLTAKCKHYDYVIHNIARGKAEDFGVLGG